jgi:hypothetical protein
VQGKMEKLFPSLEEEGGILGLVSAVERGG